MNATTAFLCIITVSIVSIAPPTQSQITAALGSNDGSASSGSQESGRPATPQKADPNATVRGAPLAGKPRQIPAPPIQSQAVEEQLRSGQMEKPVAQGEISELLNQLYSGSNRLAGETAAEPAGPDNSA